MVPTARCTQSARPACSSALVSLRLPPSREGRAEAVDRVAPDPARGGPLRCVRVLARLQDVGVLLAGAPGLRVGSCSLAESVGVLFSGGVHGTSVSPGRPGRGERGPNGG